MEELRFKYRKIWEDDGKIRKGHLFPGREIKVLEAEDIEKIIAWYLENGGQVLEIAAGCLGYGKILCTGVDGYQSILITEKFQNEWSSIHTFRCMNKVSEKLRKECENANYYETWKAV